MVDGRLITFYSILFDRNQSNKHILETLCLVNDPHFGKCVPFEILTVERVVYWLSVIQFIRQNPEHFVHLQDVISEQRKFYIYVGM